MDVNYVLYSISTYTFACPSPVTDVIALMFLRSFSGIFVGGAGINTSLSRCPTKGSSKVLDPVTGGAGGGDLYESTSHLTVPDPRKSKVVCRYVVMFDKTITLLLHLKLFIQKKLCTQCFQCSILL